MARWGNTWVQFRLVPVEKAEFEDAIHYGTAEAGKPFYRKYMVEFLLSTSDLGDAGVEKPIPTRYIQRFPGFSDPVTGLNTMCFTYQRSTWSGYALNAYIEETLNGLKTRAVDMASIPLPTGFIAPSAEVAGLRSNTQVALFQHIKLLYSKGIGFIFSDSIASSLNCSQKSVESVLKSLVERYNMLKVSKEQILSLAARAGHATQLKVFIPLKFYTLKSVTDVDLLVGKVNCVRGQIRKFFEDVQ
jgi:hypothetical protein